MDQFDYPSAGNVIPLEGKLKEGGRAAESQAGGKDDPRMKEALVLIEAFLAIDDKGSRDALVKLAQQLVTHEWARRAGRR